MDGHKTQRKVSSHVTYKPNIISSTSRFSVCHFEGGQGPVLFFFFGKKALVTRLLIPKSQVRLRARLFLFRISHLKSAFLFRISHFCIAHIAFLSCNYLRNFFLLLLSHVSNVPYRLPYGLEHGCIRPTTTTLSYNMAAILTSNTGFFIGLQDQTRLTYSNQGKGCLELSQLTITQD